VLPPAEGSDGQTASDDLPERRQVGVYTTQVLHSAVAQSGGDHFVEHEEGAGVDGQAASCLEELLRCRHRALTDARLHYQGGHFVAVSVEGLLEVPHVVV